jgi:hypothetical protein
VWNAVKKFFLKIDAMQRKLYLFIYKRKERKDPSFILSKYDLGFNRFQHNFFFWSYIFCVLFYFTVFTTHLDSIYIDLYLWFFKKYIYLSKFIPLVYSRTFEENWKLLVKFYYANENAFWVYGGIIFTVFGLWLTIDPDNK